MDPALKRVGDKNKTKGTRKRPAAAEPVDAGKPVLKRPAAAKSAIAKDVAGEGKVSLDDVLSSTQSILKYPDFVEELVKRKPLGTRPKMSQKPTSYEDFGGKIYFAKSKSQLRVYRRAGDKVEQPLKIDFSQKKESQRV